MKKKILFLSPLPPPNYGSAMSSEMCLNILKKSKNFEVRNIKLNYSKKVLDIGKINLDKVKGIKTVKNRIRRAIKEFNPDIIYFMPATARIGAIRDYFFFKEIRRHTNKKIVFHIRARIPEENWKNPVFRKIYTDMFSDKNAYAIVLGEELTSDLRGLIPKDKISILPNAIKNEVRDKELNKIIKQRNKEKTTNILFLSNMDKTKGWIKLLEACKILDEKDFNFKCHFAGAWINKKDETFFNNFKRRNNLNEKVFYVGRVEGKKKTELFQKSHIFVFPTEYKLETFGRVVIEAMMFCLPVIANSIATIPSTIQDKKTGFLLKKNTPEEIVENIGLLIKDKKLREKIGREGRKRFLKEFEIRKYVKRFKRIFNVD